MDKRPDKKKSCPLKLNKKDDVAQETKSKCVEE
jgi:hypothetical protein